MTDNSGRTPEDWRNYFDKVPLEAIVLRKGDLKKLFTIINNKQIEFRDKFMPLLAQQSNETADEFSKRKKKVYDAFVTSMTIARTNGEMLHGNNEQFLDETNLPDHIRSIFFSTASVPRALNIVPVSHIVLFLDFTVPPFFDFGRLPSLPTPNESNFEVASDNESLFSASRAKLKDFFKERRTGVDWLHAGAIYDVGLYLIGFPLSLWSVYRSSSLLNNLSLPTIIEAAIYVYIFVLGVNLFRVMFTYSRWVFPKVELESERSSPLRHRGVWAAIIIAIFGSVVSDILLKAF